MINLLTFTTTEKQQLKNDFLRVAQNNRYFFPTNCALSFPLQFNNKNIVPHLVLQFL